MEEGGVGGILFIWAGTNVGSYGITKHALETKNSSITSQYNITW